MKKKKGFLYYLYYALGEKSHPHCNKTADRVALIRLVITMQILITNCFIVFGVMKTHIIPAETKDIKCSIEYPRYMNKPFEYE